MPLTDVREIRHYARVSGPDSIMKWFTRTWHDGGLGDAEFEAAVPSYKAHVDAIRPSLSIDVQGLLDLNLHDGQVQEWSLDDHRFSWRLLVGDLQRGYSYVTLTYADADLVGATVDDLQNWALTRRGELVSDELDRTSDGRNEHRFLFWPEGEFGLQFSSATTEIVAAAPQNRRRA